MQEIITYIIVGLAVFFLVKKFFIKTKKSQGCSADCNCS
ncbi:FeoB-associated Cys-rich membrane protein [Tenacibaculum retecalamus]|nr:FeoB-associated Cys-rich membrane protein [Tenacibaculum retecalamus]WBX71139.1 FeoB-associated Cys-rich membrane protein [Tenacibaculum retecalamus]